MYTKDLLTKPDDQLTEYERQLKYGENGDPRKLNPIIDQALEVMEEKDKWNVEKVFQKSLRVGRGHANPRSLYDLVKERIHALMKAQAIKTLNAYIRERDGFMGMTVAQGWVWARQNLISALFEVTGGTVSLDVLAALADQAIAECIKANQGGEREPEFRDSQAS